MDNLILLQVSTVLTLFLDFVKALMHRIWTLKLWFNLLVVKSKIAAKRPWIEGHAGLDSCVLNTPARAEFVKCRLRPSEKLVDLQV